MSQFVHFPKNVTIQFWKILLKSSNTDCCERQVKPVTKYVSFLLGAVCHKLTRAMEKARHKSMCGGLENTVCPASPRATAQQTFNNPSWPEGTLTQWHSVPLKNNSLSWLSSSPGQTCVVLVVNWGQKSQQNFLFLQMLPIYFEGDILDTLEWVCMCYC